MMTLRSRLIRLVVYMYAGTDSCKYSLPLPLFIKADDIEYGMRAIEHLILLSGIAHLASGFYFKIQSCYGLLPQTQ